MYVDVHTHLIHPRFAGDEDTAAERAAGAGVDHVIVNGLDPPSNRAVLALADRHANVHAALGIYPVDACTAAIDRASWAHPFPPPALFDVDAEIDFIDEMAPRLIAIGECGLDQHWVRDQPEAQERVLRRLCRVARNRDLPMILHTRRAEARTFEILTEEGVERADFHCYGGRLKLAKRIAAAGFFFSIPTAVVRAEAFQQLCRALPLDRLLSETDAPFMGPRPGERNEPAFIPDGVAAMARAREIPVEEMRSAIRENFQTLFRR